MEYDQIVDLISKGFTPDQIMQLSSSGGQEPEKQEPEKQEPEKKEPEQKQEPEKNEPEQKQEPVQKNETLSALMDAINRLNDSVAEMKKVQQASNIRAVVREGSNNEITADDILAGIIRPPLDDKKEDKVK